MDRDLHNNISYVTALNSASITSNTTTNGAWIDLAGFGACEFVIRSGTITDGDYVPKIQVANASDQSDSADMDSTLLLGTYATASFLDDTDDNHVGKIGIRDGANSGYRYARLVITSTNVTTGGNLSALAVLGKPAYAPVSYTAP